MTATESVSITPELLRGVSFAEERHGYARAEVQALLAAAADALEVAWRDNEALTASGVTTEEGEISSRAVLLLSSAQRIADDAVAEAESYAKDLIETARKQYREIIERAQHVAHSIEKQAAAHPGAVAEAAAAEPAPVAAPAVGVAPAEPLGRPVALVRVRDRRSRCRRSGIAGRRRTRPPVRPHGHRPGALAARVDRTRARPARREAGAGTRAASRPAHPGPAGVPAPPAPAAPAPAAPASQEQPAADDEPSNDRPWRRGSAGR